jgi:fibrillarin-like rRNA methylase
MVVTKKERNTKLSPTTSLSTTIMATLQFESLNLSSSKKKSFEQSAKKIKETKLQHLKTTNLQQFNYNHL